jgi:FkbM family methyltransferase
MGAKSAAARWIAHNFPTPVKSALWLWARTYMRPHPWRSRPEHWLLTELAEMLQYRIPVIANLGNGMKIKVAWNDHVGRNIYDHGYYEKETVNAITRLLSPGMVFFDIGAHVGQYTLTASGLVGERGQIHSFEPDPVTYRWLTENTERNKLRNVKLNQAALFDDTNTKQLFLSDVHDVGSNSLSRPASYSGKAFDVRCTTLNEYARTNGIPRIDMMKLDIEGAEYPALVGASEILRSNDKPTLLVEFEEARQLAFGNSCRKLADLLHDYGYTLFVVGDLGREYVPRRQDPPSLNVLAIPEQKRTSILDRLAGRL